MQNFARDWNADFEQFVQLLSRVRGPNESERTVGIQPYARQSTKNYNVPVIKMNVTICRKQWLPLPPRCWFKSPMKTRTYNQTIVKPSRWWSLMDHRVNPCNVPQWPYHSRRLSCPVPFFGHGKYTLTRLKSHQIFRLVEAPTTNFIRIIYYCHLKTKAPGS